MKFFDGVELDQYQQRAGKWFADNKDLTPGFYEKLVAEIAKLR
jgi:hypothetical protein